LAGRHSMRNLVYVRRVWGIARQLREVDEWVQGWCRERGGWAPRCVTYNITVSDQLEARATIHPKWKLSPNMAICPFSLSPCSDVTLAFLLTFETWIGVRNYHKSSSTLYLKVLNTTSRPCAAARSFALHGFIQAVVTYFAVLFSYLHPAAITTQVLDQHRMASDFTTC
jgi:hypothetical protein